MGFVALVIQVSCAMVLALAAWTKLKSPKAFRDFAQSVAGLVPLPGRLVVPVAVSVALAEVLVSGGLLVPGLATQSAVVASALFAAFGAVLWRAAAAGVTTPCRCLGTTAPPGPSQAVRSLGLAVWAGTSALIPAANPRSAIGVALVVALAAGVAVAVLVADQLHALSLSSRLKES